MKRALFPDPSTFSASIGFLILRVVAGAAMAQHGWAKVGSPGGAFGWMGPEATTPGLLQGLATLSELGGGLALVFGFLTPLAMLGWVCTMGYAVYFLISKGAPWIAAKPTDPSWESALGYLGIAIAFLLAGPGRYSIDQLLLSRRGPKGQIRAGTDL
ncbi:DoxX family protein [bacterium]|nr:MAG: DoxX family protein [bacterium]